MAGKYTPLKITVGGVGAVVLATSLWAFLKPEDSSAERLCWGALTAQQAASFEAEGSRPPSDFVVSAMEKDSAECTVHQRSEPAPARFSLGLYSSEHFSKVAPDTHPLGSGLTGRTTLWAAWVWLPDSCAGRMGRPGTNVELVVQPAPQLNVQHNFDVTYIEPRLRQILLDSALNLTKKYGCSTPAFLASLQAAKAGQAGE